MKYKIYTIYDKIAEEHSPIHDAVNDAVAMRNFTNHCIKHPNRDDLLLIAIGSFDTQLGELSAIDKPTIILKGNELLPKPEVK